MRNCSKYMPPKTVMTGIYDTLRYNVVFYGDNDYIIAFCADRVYYPLNIRLVRPETGEIFYNNESDKYNRTIYVGFKKTQNCLIEVVLLAEHVKKEKLRQKENICVGMLLQIRNPLPAGDDLYLPK